jgi:Mn2+/Fe2+ NRAMP family transporter
MDSTSSPRGTPAYFESLTRAGQQIKAAARCAAFALVAALVAASLNATFGDTPAARSFSQPGLQRIGSRRRRVHLAA